MMRYREILPGLSNVDGGSALGKVLVNTHAPPTCLEMKSSTANTIFVNPSVLKGTFHHQNLRILPESTPMELERRFRQDIITVCHILGNALSNRPKCFSWVERGHFETKHAWAYLAASPNRVLERTEV